MNPELTSSSCARKLNKGGVSLSLASAKQCTVCRGTVLQVCIAVRPPWRMNQQCPPACLSRIIITETLRQENRNAPQAQ